MALDQTGRWKETYIMTFSRAFIV